MASRRTTVGAARGVRALRPARDGYRVFLTKPRSRAFALAAHNAWGWAEGGADPLRRALDNCNRRGEGRCRLHAVDDAVVWPPE